MVSFSPLALRCLDLAAAAAPGMIDRAMAAAVTAMQAEEQASANVARRQEVAEAWLELLQRRRDWRERYPQLLRSAQDGPAAVEPAAIPVEGRKKPALSLVDDEVLAQSLESSRLKQLLAPRLEQPLAELDGLMSSALGLATVHPERNPLRPDVFAQALRQVMHPAGRPHWAGLWMRHLAEPMAAELETLYRQALELLRDADMQAASYRVLPKAPTSPMSAAAQPVQPARPMQPMHPTPASAARWQAGPDDSTMPNIPLAAPGFGGSAWADLSPYAIGDELFQHFLFARTQPSTQALGTGYYAQVDQQLAQLETAAPPPAYDPEPALRYRALPPVERPHRAVGTASSLDDAVWGRWAQAEERSLVRTRLKKEARHVGQVLGLEVVRKLVDQVGRDARLLAPVREAIIALEPALSRLALVAPRFFSEEQHAGRRLVERVAERSFKFNDEFATDFYPFFSEVRNAIQGLNELGIENEQPFTSALQDLEQRWAAQDELEGQGRRVAVDAMYFAEAREAEAGQIAWSLSQRADLEGAPAVVQDFLYGPWSLVLAHARLTDSTRQPDPGGWNALVSELLWSVKREQILRDPGRLFTTIPGLLEKLRTGLALVGQGTHDNDSFFQSLEKLHEPVLKLRARKRQGSVAAAPDVDAALLSTERQKPKQSEQPWMAPAEREATGFEESLPPKAAGEELADTEVGTIVAGLQQGCWVDLYARERWRRANLTWVSSRATLFMFVSNGGRPHSMTRRSLERLVRDRLLRPVDGAAVVSRALEQLSQDKAVQPLAVQARAVQGVTPAPLLQPAAPTAAPTGPSGASAGIR